MPLASGGHSALVRISHELLPGAGKGVDVFFVLGLLRCRHMVGNTGVVFSDEVIAFGDANFLGAGGRVGGGVAGPFRTLGIAVAPAH